MADKGYREVDFSRLTLRDITDKYCKENEMQYNLNEQCTLLISQMNDIAWIASADGETLFDLNDSFERIYGYSAQE